jgi:adenylate cyclase
LGRHAEGTAAAEQALALSPNQADILAFGAWIYAQNGRAEEAVSLAESAARLNPFPPEWYFAVFGDSMLFANRIEEALLAQRKCVEQFPEFFWCRIGLALTYVEAGKLEEASVEASEAVRINPKLSAADNAYVRSIGDSEERAHAMKALRRAGLP